MSRDLCVLKKTRFFESIGKLSRQAIKRVRNVIKDLTPVISI